MRVVLTLGRCAPPGSDAVYLDYRHNEVSRRREQGYVQIAHLWPSSFRIVSYILVSPMKLSVRHLEAWLWLEDPDGGPNSSDIMLRTSLWHASKRLEPLGIAFRKKHKKYGTRGYEPVDLWITENGNSHSVPPATVL